MRQFCEGSRQSGRTHNFIMSLPDIDNQPIYIVTSSTNIGFEIKHRIGQLINKELANRTHIISLKSLYRLRGVDPLNIFFEHTAYEYATSSELRAIEEIENRQRQLWEVELT